MPDKPANPPAAPPPNPDASWESILDNVLGDAQKPDRAPAVKLGPVRAKVRPHDLEIAMVEEEGLSPLPAQPAAPAPSAPSPEDKANVRRLLTKGAAAATAPLKRTAISAAFSDLSAIMPMRVRQRRFGMQTREFLRTMGGVRNLPRKAKALLEETIDFLLLRVLAVNRLMEKSGVTWKDLAGALGILILLAVIANYFSPELKAMMGK